MSTKAARATRRGPAAGRKRTSTAPKHPQQSRSSRGRAALWAFLAIAAAIAGLYGVVQLTGGETASGGAGGYPFAVGEPGPNEPAPPLQLTSATGERFDLAQAAAAQGPVLLYFQEGLTCQPCWDQLVAIEADLDEFRALGINQIVSVTTDPRDLVQQKVDDMGITTPVLSDPDATVSDSYDARTYSMDWMRPLRNGHSFILVGPDGHIMWRADYGGEPNYTMFVPTDALLADLRRGLGAT